MSGSRLHQAADAIEAAIEAWRAHTAPAPIVVRRCTRCGKRVEQPLAAPPPRVVREHPVGGFVADVALITDAGVQGYLELVDDERLSEAKLRRLDRPHLVLSITDVLAHPEMWDPLPSTARTWQCDTCLDEVRAAPAPVALPTVEALSERLGATVPGPPYRSAVQRCFRCGRPTVVHTWDGHTAHGEESPPRPEASGLRRVYTADATHYHWANHCLQCGATQPDSLLYEHWTGPFFRE